MKIPLIIFFGGGLGTLSRYFLSRWIVSFGVTVFPYSTFLVNVLGCFLIGFLVYITELPDINDAEWRLLLVTGFCGGFTTFSSFSYESVQLLQEQRIVNFLLYACGSLLFGFLATYLGILTAKSFRF